MTSRRTAAARLWTTGAIAVVCACGTSPAAPDGLVAKGRWGGDHVTMDVTDAGATLEFDCAHARIAQPILIDGGGRFNVPGTYTPERGGPVRENDDDRTIQARFSGSVTGKTMALDIATVVGVQPIGTFSLEQGKAGRLLKCL